MLHVPRTYCIKGPLKWDVFFQWVPSCLERKYLEDFCIWPIISRAWFSSYGALRECILILLISIQPLLLPSLSSLCGFCLVHLFPCHAFREYFSEMKKMGVSISISEENKIILRCRRRYNLRLPYSPSAPNEQNPALSHLKVLSSEMDQAESRLIR
jgi:hypothetical protein